jgi:uncharacterized membrane protein YphA (DoxX/SURF4 family)
LANKNEGAYNQPWCEWILWVCMSSMSRPIWKPELAGLMVRVPIGCYFVAIACAKFRDMPGFMEGFKKLGVMPDHAAMPVAVLLPYFELLMGAFLILGLWTTLSAIISSVVLLLYMYIYGGVFEPGTEARLHTWILNKEFIVLAGCLSLLSSGAGALSIDGFRQSG